MVNFQVVETVKIPFDIHELERVVNQTLAYTGHDFNTTEVTLVLTIDQQLHDLNKEFLGIDAPTDVLSFPAEFIDPDSHQIYLGDIVISVPRASTQAKKHKHSLLAEMQLLVVHGVLHLLGYDHADKIEKEQMWKVQENILDNLENE